MPACLDGTRTQAKLLAIARFQKAHLESDVISATAQLAGGSPPASTMPGELTTGHAPRHQAASAVHLPVPLSLGRAALRFDPHLPPVDRSGGDGERSPLDERALPDPDHRGRAQKTARPLRGGAGN